MTLKMTYSGLPDAGNCVGGISNDRVKEWMGMAELGMMQSYDEESWRWDLESSFFVSQPDWLVGRLHGGYDVKI